MAITNSELPFVLLRATQAWPDNMSATDFVPQYETMRAIIENQTADIRQLGVLPDENDVKLTWLNNCDLTVDACADNVCTFSGETASSYVQTLSIDQCRQTEFSESIDVWRGNEFGLTNALSVNLIKTQKAHVEYVSQYAIGVINANLGVNEHNNMGGWTISGTDTTIPASEWESTAIFGKLRRNAIKNRLDNPFLLTGENLDQLQYMALTGQANADGKGDATRASQMRAYFDLFNVEAINTTSYQTYMINRGALAFASKGYFPLVNDPLNPRAPEVLDGNYTRFSITNRFLPQLIHDVEVEKSCASGVWKVNYRVKSRYKVFVNPTGCTTTRTGMLSFTNPGGI